MMIIETLILAFTTIVMTVLEFRSTKSLKPYEGPAYAGLGDMTEDDLLE